MFLLRLLSSCPILEYLYVLQHEQDNVTKFSVKVPSLETLIYFYRKAKVLDEEDIGRSLAIDSKILKKFFIADDSTNSCSIENKPSFDKAVIYVYSYPDDKFMRSLSSVRYLEIRLSVATVPCCHAKLKVLLIDQLWYRSEAFPLSWKKPNDIPPCLSTRLKIFEWKEYGGTSQEKQMLSYIFANSKCLKRAGISLRSTWKWNKKKIMKELKSMYRISTTSQILFSTPLVCEAELWR
ncbi:unnamed protein product [Arabidopsis thaliana]|uniref:FBD domain-containing protein n=1 Tax=Arabidopsis thaliana TaxID=3702 RepID=A0A5S9YC39_ARATH|nr:unnamed protein product [Arabidopsis thaliana]